MAEGLKRTPLHALHMRLGARMVPFAGYEMPVQYPGGIIAEHRQTRASAALFDVGHMGQAVLGGGDAAGLLEALVPGDIKGLGPGRMRYTQFTTGKGGIIDDLMVGRLDDRLFLVVNAARKETDFALLRTTSGDPGCFEILGDRALIAFQGPKAADVLSTLAPGVEALEFLGLGEFAFAGMPVLVSRSGYTGEDGFEISARAEDAEDIAQRILADERVAPAGLGARDTLRLEAGLCLYGNDIDETTTPVEAGLAFSIGKRRRTEGGFPGDSVILGQLAGGVSRRRVGILPEGRVPARAGTPISDAAGTPVGTVTSGGFAPSIDGPAAMGYVEMDQAEEGTELHLTVRGKDLAARVVKLPFVAHRYYKG